MLLSFPQPSERSHAMHFFHRIAFLMALLTMALNTTAFNSCRVSVSGTMLFTERNIGPPFIGPPRPSCVSATSSKASAPPRS